MTKNALHHIMSVALGCWMMIGLGCDSGTEPNPPAKPLELVQPKGGETYKAGETRNVSWKINDAAKISSVGVKISLDGGKTYSMLINHSIPMDTTSVSWIIDGTQESNQCVIKIYEYTAETSIYDKSGVFTVTQ
jgi:hypothetical protein